MVKETEEEEDEEDSLEYTTDTPSGGSYITPPSTGGHSPPSPAPSHLLTPVDSDPENNAVLHTKELEAHIEAFLEEVEEDLEYFATSGSGSCVSWFHSFCHEYWPALHSTKESPQEGVSSLQRSCRTMSL